MVNQNYRPNKGFSLLEMTVVLAIVAIMTGIVLMNLPQMKGGLSIDVVAQEMAIYIRGAQVYSRATKNVIGTTGIYRSYGLHFIKDSGSFFLWADQNGSVTDKNNLDYTYDEGNPPSGDGNHQEDYNLPKGFTVSKLICDGVIPPPVVTQLDIVFKLPDPEANFGFDSGQINICKQSVFVGVCLRSANTEQYRLVKTYNNGQIMVVNATDSKTSCQ